jgi:plastocyanin
MRSVGVGIAVLVIVMAGSVAHGSEEGLLSGSVRMAFAGVSLEDAGTVVVFLEPQGRMPSLGSVPPARLRQRAARFDPPFLSVAVGQVVEMPNDDIIYHNVFSYSAPNDFDLGLYAAGDARSLRFEHAGLVRVYCSIHEDMDALIFVAPTRLHAVAGPDGRYAITAVPPGRYRVRVWSERLPETDGFVVVEGATSLDLMLGTPPS